jgi:hypothetical protein
VVASIQGTSFELITYFLDESTTTEPPTSTTEETTSTKEEERTSSAVRHTVTETLDNGAIEILTSTSWVDEPAASETSETTDPDLQNRAPKQSSLPLLSVTIVIAAGAILMA